MAANFLLTSFTSNLRKTSTLADIKHKETSLSLVIVERRGLFIRFKAEKHLSRDATLEGKVRNNRRAIMVFGKVATTCPLMTSSSKNWAVGSLTSLSLFSDLSSHKLRSLFSRKLLKCSFANLKNWITSLTMLSSKWSGSASFKTLHFSTMLSSSFGRKEVKPCRYQLVALFAAG